MGMDWIFKPTAEQAAEDAAREAAEKAERERPLSWNEFKERERTLPQYKRDRDIFRLDFSTVPEDSRGVLACFRDTLKRSNPF